MKHTTRQGIESEFTKTVGIKPEQLEWLKLNKKRKSISGFLDIIINKYKK